MEGIKIELEGHIFDDMRDKFNSHLINVLAELRAGNFEEADVNLKLTVSLPKVAKEVIDEDEIGTESKATVYYNKPIFEHEIKSTFKRSTKDKGIYNENVALKVNEDGELVIVQVQSAQMTMAEFSEQVLLQQGQRDLNELAKYR
jgi:hypothetical protein